MKLLAGPWSFIGWRLEFKPEDCWVGVFWKRKLEQIPERADGALVETRDIWICLLPMVPLHLQYVRFWSGAAPVEISMARIW